MDTTLFCSPSTPRQLGSIPAPRYGGNDSEDPELDAVDRSPSSSGSPAWDALRPVVVAGGRVGAAAATAVVSAGSPFSYSALNSPAVSSTSPTSQTHGQSAHTANTPHNGPNIVQSLVYLQGPAPYAPCSLASETWTNVFGFMDFPGLMSATYVCHQWREAALRCPALWANWTIRIQGADVPEPVLARWLQTTDALDFVETKMIAKLLPRSGVVPLSFSIALLGPPSHDLNELLRVHARRIIALNILSDQKDDLEDLSVFGERVAPMPRIQALQLYHRHDTDLEDDEARLPPSMDQVNALADLLNPSEYAVASTLLALRTSERIEWYHVQASLFQSLCVLELHIHATGDFCWALCACPRVEVIRIHVQEDLVDRIQIDDEYLPTPSRVNDISISGPAVNSLCDGEGSLLALVEWCAPRKLVRIDCAEMWPQTSSLIAGLGGISEYAHTPGPLRHEITARSDGGNARILTAPFLLAQKDYEVWENFYLGIWNHLQFCSRMDVPEMYHVLETSEMDFGGR